MRGWSSPQRTMCPSKIWIVSTSSGSLCLHYKRCHDTLCYHYTPHTFYCHSWWIPASTACTRPWSWLCRLLWSICSWIGFPPHQSPQSWWTHLPWGHEFFWSWQVDFRHTGWTQELMREMGVYKLIPHSDVPAGCKVLCGKWVLLLKRDEHGNPIWHKACFVVKGFEQVFGQDYVDTTSPTARMESVRLLLNIAAAKDWDIQQIDVKTAFLYGFLPADEAQYLEQPEAFAEPGKEDWVWCLQRGLYGMKQSGCIWNKTMHKAMLSWGFKHLHADPCVYYRVTPLGMVLSAVHVNNFLIISSTPDASRSFKEELKSLWTISDLGEACFCVGIAISHDRANCLVSISQTALIDRVILQFGQTEADPISTPMDPSVAKTLTQPSPSDPPLSDNDSCELAHISYSSLVGSLMYLAMGTPPDISFAVAHLCQVLDCYCHAHWNAAIRVVRYLKGTRLLTLTLGGNPELDLVGFSDSSYADCLDTARSTMGYCFSVGSAIFTWSSRRQKTVSNSSCEAEYIALSEASCEALWLCQFLREVYLLKPAPTVILCDNNGAKALSSDPTHHSWSKHINVHHHFVHEHVNDGSLTIWRVPGYDNVADIFTKALPRPDFTRLQPYLGLRWHLCEEEFSQLASQLWSS